MYMSELPNLRKRRGVTRASITKLSTRLKTLESKVREPTTVDLARQLATNLKSLDAQFKSQHFDIIDENDSDFLAGQARRGDLYNISPYSAIDKKMLAHLRSWRVKDHVM